MFWKKSGNPAFALVLLVPVRKTCLIYLLGINFILHRVRAYYYKEYSSWYLGFYRNFSISKISAISIRSGDEFFNELNADTLSNRPGVFEIYCTDFEFDGFIWRQLKTQYKTEKTAKIKYAKSRQTRILTGSKSRLSKIPITHNLT